LLFAARSHTAVIDDVECPEPTAIGQVFGGETNRPALTATIRNQHWHPGAVDLPVSICSCLKTKLAYIWQRLLRLITNSSFFRISWSRR